MVDENEKFTNNPKHVLAYVQVEACLWSFGSYYEYFVKLLLESWRETICFLCVFSLSVCHFCCAVVHVIDDDSIFGGGSSTVINQIFLSLNDSYSM
jgi:succinate dehydrogenase/fumarate reductase cytochrome b subunit